MSMLSNKLLVQERHSHSYNIRIGGIREVNKEDCFASLYETFEKFGISEVDYHGQVDNAHRNINNIRPRHIIFKCYSRPFHAYVLRRAKSLCNRNKLGHIFILEDLTKEDFELKQRARPLMATAYEEGKKSPVQIGKAIY